MSVYRILGLGRLPLTCLLGCLTLGAGPAWGTTLTFEIEGATPFFPALDLSYGNRVAASPDGAFHYDNEGGFTPHISLAYGTPQPEDDPDLRFGGDFYANLEGAVFQREEIRLIFTADEGFVVNLHSFDLGAFADEFDEDPVVDVIEVTDSSGEVVFQDLDSAVSDETARTISFDPPLNSDELVLSVRFPSLVDIGWSDAIGIDNVLFSESLDFSASIEGTVFEDLNRNGLQDDGEPGIQGQQLVLDLEGQGMQFTITGEDGSYQFEKLAPLPYRLAYLWDDNGLTYIPTAPGNPAAQHTGDLENGEILQFDLGMVSLVSLQGRRPTAPQLNLTAGVPGELAVNWSSEPLSDTLSGDLFPRYQLQVSEDLVDWSPVGGTLQAVTKGELLGVAVIAPPAGKGFYRVALDLSELDLTRMNLAGLDLRGIDLTGANLFGADLRGADLRGADLRDADLTDAFLEGALLDGALFANDTLARVSGTPLITLITGEVEQEVAEAVSFLPYSPRSEDYVLDPNSGTGDSLRILIVVPTQQCTVSEFNTVLADSDARIVGAIPGVKSISPAILTLWLPTSTPQEVLETAVALEAHPCIEKVVPDLAGWAPALLPTDSKGHPDWDWDTSSPSGGNWGLEMCQIPQLWNLNPALEKGISSLTRTLIDTGVIDSGFTATHEDLILQQYYPAGTVFKDPEDIGHGNHVAGTLGAEHGNNLGIQGVNPFSALMVAAPTDGVLSFNWQMSEVFRLAQAGATVINMSLEFRWGELATPVDPGSDPAVQKAWDSHGDLAATLLFSLKAAGFGPVICYCAGNQSEQLSLGFVDIEARWNSPFANAGLRGLVDNVFVIEAVGSSSGSYYSTNGALNLADLWRSPFSNVGGHFAAPGEVVLSASYPKKYELLDGTSMASPFFAGVASYLLMLDPTLTPSELNHIFTATSLTVPDDDDPASPDGLLIQAFDAALYVDHVRGTNDILRMLLDIDDGTPDGNLRVEPETRNDFIDEDVDGDGGQGDEQIDMSDFRRWRDWMLQYRKSTETNFSLDGAPDHPKKDLNGNGKVDTPREYHPRGDFNGDTRLDIGLPALDGREIPGRGIHTDLTLLKLLFDDPHYEPGDLDLLRDSGDIHVDASYMLTNVPGATSVSIRVFRKETDGTLSLLDGHVADSVVGELQVFTVATGPETPTGYKVEADANAGGTVLSSDSREFNVKLGGDSYWKPGRKVFEVVSSSSIFGYSAAYRETVSTVPSAGGVLIDVVKDVRDIVDGELEAGFAGTAIAEEVISEISGGSSEGSVSLSWSYENAESRIRSLNGEEKARYPEVTDNMQVTEVGGVGFVTRTTKQYWVKEHAQITLELVVDEIVAAHGRIGIGIGHSGFSGIDLRFEDLPSTGGSASKSFEFGPGSIDISAEFVGSGPFGAVLGFSPSGKVTGFLKYTILPAD